MIQTVIYNGRNESVLKWLVSCKWLCMPYTFLYHFVVSSHKIKSPDVTVYVFTCMKQFQYGHWHAATGSIKYFHGLQMHSHELIVSKIKTINAMIPCWNWLIQWKTMMIMMMMTGRVWKVNLWKIISDRIDWKKK